MFSILGSWREFKCGEESSVLPETFMRGIAQALGGAWWLLRHFAEKLFLRCFGFAQQPVLMRCGSWRSRHGSDSVPPDIATRRQLPLTL